MSRSRLFVEIRSRPTYLTRDVCFEIRVILPTDEVSKMSSVICMARFYQLKSVCTRMYAPASAGFSGKALQRRYDTLYALLKSPVADACIRILPHPLPQRRVGNQRL